MSKHLTPDEAADAIEMRPDRLVRFAIRRCIPASEGRVDTPLVLKRLEGDGPGLPGSTEDLLAAERWQGAPRTCPGGERRGRR